MRGDWRPEGSTRRRRVVLGVLLAALVWTLYGLALETAGWRRRVAAPLGPGAVAEWRLGEPRAASLEHFLLTLAPELPPGAALQLSTAGLPSDQQLFLSLWTAYFLPAQRVVALDPWHGLDEVDYVIAYNSALDDPRLAQVAKRPEGRLYRVVPGATGPLRGPVAVSAAP